MSKVIAWFEGGNILKGDCGHFFETDVQVDTGAEVDCPACAEVKAARVEALKEARQNIKWDLDQINLPIGDREGQRYCTGLHDGIIIIDNLLLEAK